MNDVIIRIEHLRKEFPNAVPLKDVSAEIKRGEIVSIIGPSGTGKSTLLRCINGLETVTSGKVFVGEAEVTDANCDLSAVRKKIGMVFQSFNLFDNLNVIDNIAKPPVELLGMSNEEGRANAMSLLEKFDLADKAANFPDELSGGQRQRVAIARTLAMNPDIIMFDEPTSALDPSKVQEVQAIIKEIAAEGKTVLIVTHEMRFAREVSTLVYYMDEGGIYEEGTPEEIFDHPKKDKTLKFIRQLQSANIDIENLEFSLIDFMGQMKQFAVNTGLPRKRLMTLQVMFEEIVYVQLLHMRKPFTPIHVDIEYSRADGSIEMNINYDGERWNPFELNEELVLEIKQYVVKEFDYKYIDGMNIIKIEM